MFKRKPQVRDNPDRNFQLLTLRVPHALANAVRAAAERNFEPQSAFVRRWLQRGVEDAERQQQAAGGAR